VATILIFIVLIAVLWFFMIRPQQRRQREAQQMQAELAPGAQVMLTSGIFGVVREITDDYILVEVSEGAAIKVVRAAIGRVMPEDFGQQVDASDGEPAAAETSETSETSESNELNAASDSVVVEPIEPEDDR